MKNIIKNNNWSTEEIYGMEIPHNWQSGKEKEDAFMKNLPTANARLKYILSKNYK